MLIQHKRSLNAIQYKAFNVEVKEISSDSRTIKGYAAIFNNKDSQGDVLLPGCFSKSISERGPNSPSKAKVAFLNQHEMDEPLGRITVLQEDEKGLYFECELDKIQKADEVLTQLLSGTLNQFSIGFSYVWDKCRYDSEQDAYIVGEVKLYEISVVTLGANEETYFIGLKSENVEGETLKLNRELDRFAKTLSQEDNIKMRNFIRKFTDLHAAHSTPEPPRTPQKVEEPPKAWNMF